MDFLDKACNSPRTTSQMEQLKIKDKLYKAQDQLHLLVIQRNQLEIRFDRAVQQGQKSFSYQLKLRLATLDELISAFHEYVEHRIQKLVVMMATRTQQLSRLPMLPPCTSSLAMSMDSDCSDLDESNMSLGSELSDSDSEFEWSK